MQPVRKTCHLFEMTAKLIKKRDKNHYQKINVKSYLNVSKLSSPSYESVVG